MSLEGNQLERICATVADLMGKKGRGLFGHDGPTDLGWMALEGHAGDFSTTQRILLEAAFAVHGSAKAAGAPTLQDILRLGDRTQRAIGELIEVLAHFDRHPHNVEEWLAKWGCWSRAGSRARGPARPPGGADSNPDHVGSDADPGL